MKLDITYANIEKANKFFGWKPDTTFEDGMNTVL